MPLSMRICIALETPRNSKKNIFKFKWIQNIDTKMYYEIPADKQNPSDHCALFAVQKVKNILSSIKTTGSFRACVIPLTTELEQLYFDDDGDVISKEEYLQLTYSPVYETKPEKEQTVLSELLKKIKEMNISVSNKKDIKDIKDNFVLNNFDGKNASVTSSLETFETQCSRCGVEADADKILTLRLFLGGTAKEWFASKLIVLG
ncbi:uncharacterized protein LOC123312909 [Coccinella septempunctata]|uniref:uncharacterized protein LOC123312909 n=1 Tax=Coccinella septempunctata TaxID=41139 RepID=UPI001D07E612|nr:uncharacterized protein LOC123312909 [Coccinella septempunctata]